jgi:hypothetical protein
MDGTQPAKAGTPNPAGPWFLALMRAKNLRVQASHESPIPCQEHHFA